MSEKELDPILYDIFKENQVITKHIRIGLTRLIILWKISEGPTHGYELMKTIDEFFKMEIEYGLINKANASSIYPILKSFEEIGVVVGEWELKNNKNIKVYKITEKGKISLEALKDKLNEKIKDDVWMNFMGYIFD